MEDISALLETAIAHHQAGRLADAEKLYRRILNADPNCVNAWNLMGLMASQLNKHDVALQCLQNALQFEPASAEIHYNIGAAYQGLKRFDEALGSYQRAIEIDPVHARAYNNLGAVLTEQTKYAEATACLQHALQLDPNLAQSYCNLGNILHEQAQWDESRPYFERAIALNPDFAAAHTNYAMVLLASGDFRRGWPEYEWRWKAGQLPRRPFEQPRWEGEPLHGKTVLLHAEQGLGDVFQFVRYAPLVKLLGATVIVECPKPLARLLSACPGIDQTIHAGDDPPPFDFQAALLSLPRLFQTTLSNVPAQIPYLSADSELVTYWRERLSALPGFRIAVNWRGRAGQGFFRNRDIPLDHFTSLAAFPISLISLQKGATPEEFAEVNSRIPIFHPGDDFDQSRGGFMDTAAIMQNVDLVISSDTSLPHLAGALGAPVWVALPHVAGWQWMRDRTDSPWYPTARLFRQKSPDDWHTVFNDMRVALDQRLQSRSSP